MTAALDGWQRTEFTADGRTRAVYRRGDGPGVIVIHEIPGITPKVTQFIGNQRPQEVRPQEIEEQRRRVVEGAVKPKPRVNFDVGDEIRVIDGAFANFSGTVEEVKPDKQKLKVMVSIFGRPTPVELDFSHVEKR